MSGDVPGRDGVIVGTDALREDAARSLYAAARMLGAARDELRRALEDLAMTGERGFRVDALYDAIDVVHQRVVLCVQTSAVVSPRSTEQERADAVARGLLLGWRLDFVEVDDPWMPFEDDSEQEVRG